MPRAFAWFLNNDMLVQLSDLRSSTASSTGPYINSSTGVTVTIYPTQSTLSTPTVSGVQMAYVGGTNGIYRYAAQHTAFGSYEEENKGMAIVSVAHSGLDGEFRAPFRVEYRGST
jgi:hypothetical protein